MNTQFNYMNLVGTAGNCFMNNYMYGNTFGGGYCGSIFNMLFNGVNTYGNYNYGCGAYGDIDFDRMAGFGIATVLTGLGVSLLGSFLNAKAADNAVNGKEALTTTVQNCNDKINAQLEKLGVSNEAEVATLAIDPELDTKVTETEAALNAAKAKVNDAKEGLTATTNKINTTQDDIKKLKIVKENPNTTEAKKSEIANLIAQKETELVDLQTKERELKELKAKTESNGELYKAHQEAVKEKETREKVIADGKAEVASLVEQRDEAQAKLDAIAATEQEKVDKKTLNKGDGTIAGRRSEKNQRYEYTETGIQKKEEFEDKDWRSLIHDYRKGSPEVQKKIKAYVTNSWNDIQNKYGDTTSIRQALAIIKEKEIA